MSGKKRICKTCAWFKESVFADANGQCQFEPRTESKHKEEFCRHHSFTRGWSEDEGASIGNLMHNPFEPVTEDEKELVKQINQAWEVYRKLVSDWYLMKDK